ncbi:MAG TPA: GH1 family beta-glucosidase [Ktedonobacterales bacterium]
MTQESTRSASGFPSGFYWGTATAAYQIEGAPTADGKGESIWDRFTHTPGNIANGETGDIANDHYHRWPEDLDLMRSLNLNAYRFSVSWPRIFPEGYGRINEAGLDFYSRLVDGMLARGLEPFLTLYHWDLPQALQDKGGWENRDTAKAFGDYTTALARRLGDRVTRWITLNEPSGIVALGNVFGEHAPGKKDPSLILPLTHHLLVSHGIATQALRAESPRAPQIGITLNLSVIEPASDREDDVAAAQAYEGVRQTMYLEALYHKTYGDEIMTLLQMLGGSPDVILPGDMDLIATPTDFLGVNYYTRTVIRAGRGAVPLPDVVITGSPLTLMDWEIYPQGLRDLLTSVSNTYKPGVMYVTENGAAFTDVVDAQGKINDTARRNYLEAHFQATREAIAAGAPVQGFFVWTFADNFEWAKGFMPRFGVVYVDFPTQRRTVKASGLFLAEVAATNGASLGAS